MRHARARSRRVQPPAQPCLLLPVLGWALRVDQVFICGQPIALASNESPAGREVGVVSELYEARVKNGSWHVIEFFFLEW